MREVRISTHATCEGRLVRGDVSPGRWGIRGYEDRRVGSDEMHVSSCWNSNQAHEGPLRAAALETRS